MLTFTKSMLALSVMAAVGGANAATYTEDTTLTDKIFTEGIMAIDGATVTVTGDERECQDFCVWGGYSRGSPTRLPFVFCDAVCQT